MYYKVNSKGDFLSKLNTGKRYDIIHVSAHGPPKNHVGIGNGSTWLASPEEIEATNHKARLLFANACLANRMIMAKAFKGARHFLAPVTDVEWIDAAVFSSLFYKRYIVDGSEMESAFKYAKKRTQTSKDYPYYWE